MKARIVVLGLSWAAATMGCGPTPVPSPAPPASPLIAVPSGLHTRMTATDVEDLVLGWIHENEAMLGRVLKPARIVSVRASGGPIAGIVWAVEAEGTFTTNREPPGASGPAAGTSGTYRILDADGTIAEYGFH